MSMTTCWLCGHTDRSFCTEACEVLPGKLKLFGGTASDPPRPYSVALAPPPPSSLSPLLAVTEPAA